MGDRPIIFARRAQTDLRMIFSYIAADAGVSIAEGYRGRLDGFLRVLETFPNAGRQLRNGDRRLGFERRMNIIYRVRTADVLILRVLYAGRQISKAQEPS